MQGKFVSDKTWHKRKNELKRICLTLTPKVLGSIPGVYISFLIHSFFCAKFCPKQISPAYQHQTFPVNVQKNYINTLLCAKFCLKQISPAYQHQTFPVNVRKNYIMYSA